MTDIPPFMLYIKTEKEKKKDCSDISAEGTLITCYELSTRHIGVTWYNMSLSTFFLLFEFIIANKTMMLL
jgi:hypothetical protein